MYGEYPAPGLCDERVKFLFLFPPVSFERVVHRLFSAGAGVVKAGPHTAKP